MATGVGGLAAGLVVGAAAGYVIGKSKSKTNS